MALTFQLGNGMSDDKNDESEPYRGHLCGGEG